MGSRTWPWRFLRIPAGMRLFLAINLPPALRTRIHRETDPLRRAAPSVAWINAELLHFTVKFLGEVADERVSPIGAEVSKAVSGRAPFTLRLAGAGAFPNFRRPRVVWIGVREHHAVNALAEDVEQACELLGFDRDARSFSAHLTLGRVKSDLSRGSVDALERAAGSMHNEYEVGVRTLDLVRSNLGAGGPRYSVVRSMALGMRE